MDNIRTHIARHLLSIGAVFLRPDEPFVWASGIKSPIYCDNRLILTAPEELKLPRYVKEQYIKSRNIPYIQSTSLDEVMPELDILYMTRVQRERFFNEEDYLRLKDSYILTPEKLKNAKPDLRILHPLPRVNEISVAVDEDPRACYFKQVQYGKYIRMALILKLLNIA